MTCLIFCSLFYGIVFLFLSDLTSLCISRAQTFYYFVAICAVCLSPPHLVFVSRLRAWVLVKMTLHSHFAKEEERGLFISAQTSFKVIFFREWVRV